MPKIPWTPSDDDFDALWEDSVDLGQPLHVVPDMLATMFAQQADHMRAYMALEDKRGVNVNDVKFLEPHLWGVITDRKVQAALRENAGYVVEELYEAIGLLKNKPWRETALPASEQSFREELADVWHFFIQLHILAGMNPLDVFQEYFRKSLINQHRQQTGY